MNIDLYTLQCHMQPVLLCHDSSRNGNSRFILQIDLHWHTATPPSSMCSQRRGLYVTNELTDKEVRIW